MHNRNCARSIGVSGAALSLFLLFFCGIYRTDVPKEKYIELGAQPQFECVGKVLRTSDGNLEGSCVLIDATHALSAAHVFIETETRPDTIFDSGTRIIVNKPVRSRPGSAGNYSLSFAGKTYRCKALRMHPAYLDSATRGSCDLVIIELDIRVTNVKPAMLNTRFDELHAIVSGTGYGVSGPASPADSVAPKSEKIGGMNTIDTLAGYILNGQPCLLQFDFDSPTDRQLSTLGKVEPLPLEYSSAGGDSGGGLFRQDKNGWKLVGICSGTSNDIETLIRHGYYGGISKWTRVSVFADWIRKGVE